MLNQPLFESAIRNTCSITDLRKTLQIQDDTELIAEMFKYIKMLIRNYFRAKNMKIEEPLRYFSSCMVYFSRKSNSLAEMIMEKYNELNAYIIEQHKKASGKDRDQKRKKLIADLKTDQIERTDINYVDWDNPDVIMRFIANQSIDINRMDYDDKHIINILLRKYSSCLKRCHHNHPYLRRMIEEIFESYDLTINDSNIEEIESCLADLATHYSHNPNVKFLQGLIEGQKAKQLINSFFNDDNAVDRYISSTESSMNKDLYNRVYSTIYCIAETNCENYQIINKLLIFLNRIIDKGVISTKAAMMDLEKLTNLINRRRTGEITESYKNYLDSFNYLVDGIHDILKERRKEAALSKAENRFSTRLDIPLGYDRSTVAKIILPTPREGFTGSKIITIDNITSPDLDDALSLYIDHDGNYNLSVHIANVGKVLLSNPFLIEEVLKRCTSIYLSNNNIIHMLPEILSIDRCSLVAGQYRDVITNQFTIDRKGVVQSYSCFENTIRVTKRFSYKEVDQILKIPTLDEEYYDMLNDLYELTATLKNKTKRNLFIYEQVDDEDITYASQDIIEETAVLTNKHIAGLSIAERNMYPFVYRSHVEGERAIYGQEPKFHYGLNLQQYTHFTSPIRRIVDAILQMILIDLRFRTTPIYQNYEQWDDFLKTNLPVINERTGHAREYTRRYNMKIRNINNGL